MNKRIRMMEKAFPSFHAKKYFATKDKSQIPFRAFVLMLRMGHELFPKVIRYGENGVSYYSGEFWV